MQLEPSPQFTSRGVVCREAGEAQRSLSVPSRQGQCCPARFQRGRQVSRKGQRNCQRSAVGFFRRLSECEPLLQSLWPVDVPLRQRSSPELDSIRPGLWSSLADSKKSVPVAITAQCKP